MTDPGVLEVSVHIAAKPETVFPYFTDSARYVQCCLGAWSHRQTGSSSWCRELQR
jgi:hypothetical protein